VPGAQRDGFTLIEMLVVLIALALVAAAVVPSMAAAGRQGELDRAAARVVASARFARETAMDLQAPVMMSVETAPDAVRLFWEEADSPLPEASTGASSRGEEPVSRAMLPVKFAFVPLPVRITAHLEAEGDGTVAAAPAGIRGAHGTGGVLRFPADGRPEGGVVILMDDRGRERRILVTPETGVVRIERGDE
jgi:prepilin-type N-terminal cleavage/methylation domain-containing protein